MSSQRTMLMRTTNQNRNQNHPYNLWIPPLAVYETATGSRVGSGSRSAVSPSPDVAPPASSR